jgi:hypothetical protein
VALSAIRARCPELDTAIRHVDGYARTIENRSRNTGTLTDWMSAVNTDLTVPRSFTARVPP